MAASSSGVDSKPGYSPHWHPPYGKPRIVVIGPCPIGSNPWLKCGPGLFGRLRRWLRELS